MSLLGWMTGFEPATSGSTIRRSNQLSYTHHSKELRWTELRRLDLSKERRRPATGVRRSTSVVEGGLHFGENHRSGGGAGSAAALMGRPTTR